MALKLKYKDEHGILQIDMSPASSPRDEPTDISDPKFDTINHRFGQYDLFGGKYDYGGDTNSLFRSRYNSIEEELANTPYAFATERSLRATDSLVDITIDSHNDSIDIEYGLFGPQIDYENAETPAFTVTQLIHAQDRYFDLSSQKSKDEKVGTVRSIAGNFEVRSAPGSAKRTVRLGSRSGSEKREAFKVLAADTKTSVTPAKLPVVPTPKKKKETSFAIIAEPPVSRPTSPKSLPVEIRPGRVSPFKGRGFREETSRHNTPKTSAANSRCSSPPRRRTSSLSRIDKMATATMPPPVHLSRPHSPRNFLKQNIEEVRELSELNREKHEAEAEQKRREEEEALLKEMGLLDKNPRSRVNSRSNSRSTSPIKIKIKSRSNSPSAVLYYENIPANSSDFVNAEDVPTKPVAHRSRLRSMTKSQPQSNNGSPKNSKIPQRQNSVSPVRNRGYDMFSHKKPFESNLNKNQRFISNSTSSIHETIKIGSRVHDKRDISKSTQHLDISPTVIKSKPPISPGRSGPPPSNKSINAKRLSPIVGTPSKSPIEDTKSGSAKTSSKPTPATRKPVKTAGNTPAATSRLNSRTASRTASRDPSPDKRKNVSKVSPPKPLNNSTKPASRVPSSKTAQKPPTTTKADVKKPMNRTNSTKSLIRTPSSKNLNEKPPVLKKRDSKKDLTEKTKSSNKINEIGRTDVPSDQNIQKMDHIESFKDNMDMAKDVDEITTQDNETQYDKVTNENGELVILTKKNIVSMTTAAITSQPLEVVATVTNQLPNALEKAREKAMFERLSSKDSLFPKDEETEATKEAAEEKEKVEKMEKEEKKPPPKPPKSEKSIFSDDNVKLKLLQPPYNNPQVERVKQKIDDILKEPEISTENILASTPKAKQNLKNTAEAIKTEVVEGVTDEIKNLTQAKDDTIKQSEKIAAEIRSEASKIVDSIITPVEEPKEIIEKTKIEIKENIEPIITVVNEKKSDLKTETIEKINESLVKGEAEVEVQSSNVSTPGVQKLTVPGNVADGSESDRSAQSNGGFPQSTSTTPKPPARAHRQPKEDKTPPTEPELPTEAEESQLKPNICQRLMGKCKAKCCTCCVKPQKEEESKAEEIPEATEEGEKKSVWKKLNCFKKKGVDVEDVERAAGKAATIEFESETKRKRKLRDILCSCCRRKRISDVAEPPRQVEVSSPVMSADVVQETGCCGKKREAERRDSILSDQSGNTCCNNRLCRWIRGACRRQSEQSSSRRTSLFSKNKSLSPTLPPEDTRTKLDASLVEHTSVMRGAIPVLPIALAYFCLVCNVLVPGLGTIFSGMFCLCFGIPRFGVHDGAKHRIGSLVINLVVGGGQLFTVLFCLVGWGWSVWWGVIMLRVSRKYRKLKAEAMADEPEAPPITSNNHTRA